MTRLDEVSIFDGKLTFLIPHDWVEGEEDDDKDTYLYRLPNTDSGWFRVSLITASANDPLLKLQELFKDAPLISRNLSTGSLIEANQKFSVDQATGSPLQIYFWKVGNIVRPGLVREAVFSYTILRDQMQEPHVQDTVRLLEQLVSQAKFS